MSVSKALSMSLVAGFLVGLASGPVAARNGADDGPGHHATDDRGGASGKSGGSGSGSGATRLEARLSGPIMAGIMPSGHASWRMRGDVTRFSVEGEDIHTTDPTPLEVKILLPCDAANVTGTEIAVATVGGAPDFGFDVNRDSRLGETVPAVANGDVICVAKTADNTLVMSGSFSPK